MQIDALHGEWLGPGLPVPFTVPGCTVDALRPHMLIWNSLHDFEQQAVPRLVNCARDWELQRIVHAPIHDQYSVTNELWSIDDE